MQTPFISIDKEEVAQPAPPKAKVHQDIQVQPAPPKAKALQNIQVQPAPPQISTTNIFQASLTQQKNCLQFPTTNIFQASPTQQNQYNNLFTQCLKTHDKWEKQDKTIKDLEDRVRSIETQIMKMQKKKQKAFSLIRYIVEDLDS